jgi:hypothetical protein
MTASGTGQLTQFRKQCIRLANTFMRQQFGIWPIDGHCKHFWLRKISCASRSAGDIRPDSAFFPARPGTDMAEKKTAAMMPPFPCLYGAC